MTSPARKAASHAGNRVLGIPVREDRGAGALDHGGVTARMIAMLVRVQDLGDREALVLRGLQALLVVEGIDRERLTRFPRTR